MTVTMDAGNGHAHSNVRFAVWSSANGQDDLTWYTAKKNSSGQWTYSVPLVNHNSTGSYFIHAYSSDSGQNRLIGNTTAQVAKLPAPDSVTAQVSADYRTMSVQLDTARSYSGIRFAVWSSAGGQDDLTWYTAKSAGGNRWTYNVDLAKHNSTGTYFIHVYSGKTLVAHTTAQVKSLPPAAPGVKTGLTATVSSDNAAIELALTTAAKYGKVRFAVWSSAGGQDDLVWYDGRLNGNTWSAGVKLLNHKTLGGYFIHVYADGKLVAHTTANVHGMPPQQSAQAIVTDDFNWMRLRLYSAAGYSNVRFAVWSSAGGQDDLTWYKAENIGGAWVAAANLAKHNSTGTYFIHIYAGNKLVAHTTVTVKSLPNG